MVMILVYKPEAAKEICQDLKTQNPEIPCIEKYYKYLPNLNMGLLDTKVAENYGVSFDKEHINLQSFEEDSQVEAIFVKEGLNSKQSLEVGALLVDDQESTWGLKATGVVDSPYTGKGVKVCILDTGFDKNHPDFKGRKITTASFVPGESPDDGHGHGTHCIGTACGYKDQNGRRYGVAYECEILSGKVLSNRGSGSTAGILEGIDWAIGQGAHIISMSLGNTDPNPGKAYEEAGRRALEKGSLIIAAAGNHRPGTVGQPANSPSFVAVGAIDSKQELAYFSCGSGTQKGSEVSLVAPGVDVYSSIPSGRYASWSGTSMATPHAAGMAALWVQCSGETDSSLRRELEDSAEFIEDIKEVDQGYGLTVAPL